MDLANEADTVTSCPEEPGDLLPLAVVAAQLEIADGEEVCGVLLERIADQAMSPWGLRPTEAVDRLGFSYEHHRDWDGRDRPASDRTDARTLWRPVPAAGIHRTRDCLLYAPPEPGAAPRRPLRR